MRIITFRRIKEFSDKHADSDVALREWYGKTLKGNWECFADVKKCFNSVDAVGNKRFVFNIRGNSFRLVAIILFKTKMVYIRIICNHSDYEKIDSKNI